MSSDQESRHPDEHLAPYAVRSLSGGQRKHQQPPDPLRDPFAVDRRRIINCTAFRRLQQKTQVFAPSHHDHFRTRLTHTLEVAEIARTLAGRLGVSESLVEAISLAHDLGHPPFGHAGEAAMNEAMQNSGGFNHNTHAARVVEYLEHPYPEFRGLNLTVATLAGLRSHATQFDTPECNSKGSSVEAQIASVADRVAYDCHDLEDAIGADLIDLESLNGLALWRNASTGQAGRTIHAIRRVVLDDMLDAVLTDVIDASKIELEPIGSPQLVLEIDDPQVGPTAKMEASLVELETCLAHRVYKQPVIQEADADGHRMVLTLFEAFRTNPSALPQRFRARVDDQGLDPVIRDYIAGMTDRFCRDQHERICGE